MAHTRRGDIGLGKTAGGGNVGSFAAHERGKAAPPPTTSPLNQYFETLDDKLTAMSEEVASAVERLRTDEGWNEYLDTMSRFHSYSFANQMLIAIQKPDATHVGGKGMWKSLGRELLPASERGAGISIFRPVTGYRNRVDSDGNPVLDDDGKPIRERAVFKYSATTIYDISQTKGKALPDGGNVTLSEEVPEGLEEDIDSCIERLGYSLSEEPMSGSRKGYTTVDGSKRIVVREGLTPAERTRVKLHEVGHVVAGHVDGDRYAEYHTGSGGQRGAMEVEADSISHVMLRMNGMNPIESTSRYAAGWASVQSDDPDVVKNAAAGVQKAVKTLIAEHGWRNVSLPEKPEYRPQSRARSGTKR